MNTFTIGTFEEAIFNMEKHFDVDYDGLTIKESINNLRQLCPKLHTDEELREFSKQLVENIYQEFGFTGLRIWYSLHMSSIFPNSDLEMKYHKLDKDIVNYVNQFREESGIILSIDVYLSVIYLKEYFKKEYGLIHEDVLPDVHSILRTIYLTGFNEEVINLLAETLEFELKCSGDNFYHEKDLTDVNVLKELYEYTGEEIGEDDCYKGHWLGHDYDGYGNSQFKA